MSSLFSRDPVEFQAMIFPRSGFVSFAHFDTVRSPSVSPITCDIRTLTQCVTHCLRSDCTCRRPVAMAMIFEARLIILHVLNHRNVFHGIGPCCGFVAGYADAQNRPRAPWLWRHIRVRRQPAFPNPPRPVLRTSKPSWRCTGPAAAAAARSSRSKLNIL